MSESILSKHLLHRFLFPALGTLLFGYEIGATSCAIISIKVMAYPLLKTLLNLVLKSEDNLFK